MVIDKDSSDIAHLYIDDVLVATSTLQMLEHSQKSTSHGVVWSSGSTTGDGRTVLFQDISLNIFSEDTVQATVDTDGNWEATIPAADLPDDQYINVTAIATDSAGNNNTDGTLGNANNVNADGIFVDTIFEPIVSKFSVTVGDGNYNTGDKIGIIATMSEAVTEDSTLTVMLSTGEKITLERVGNRKLGFNYQIGANAQSGDLTVTGFVSANVTEKTLGYQMDLTVPMEDNLGENIDVNHAITINDTTAPTIDSVQTVLIDEVVWVDGKQMATTVYEYLTHIAIDGINSQDKQSFIDTESHVWQSGAISQGTVNQDFSASTTPSVASPESNTFIFGISHDENSDWMEYTVDDVDSVAADYVDLNHDHYKDVNYGIMFKVVYDVCYIEIYNDGVMETGWVAPSNQLTELYGHLDTYNLWGAVNESHDMYQGSESDRLMVHKGDRLTVRKEGNDILYMVNGTEVYRQYGVLNGDEEFYIDLEVATTDTGLIDTRRSSKFLSVNSHLFYNPLLLIYLKIITT